MDSNAVDSVVLEIEGGELYHGLGVRAGYVVSEG